MHIRTAAKRTVATARPEAGVRPRRHRVANWVAVWVLTALVAAAYNVFALVQFYTFRTSADDLLIFDEAVRSYSHFKPGVSIFFGFHEGFGPSFSILGDHWSPVLIALAPLYWLFNSPQTLLVVQAVLFALAIPPLWVFTRRAFGGSRKATAAAYLVSVAYAVSWPLASALAFQFHEVAFAPVLMAVALERIQAGRLRTALIAIAGLLLVKEDMGLFVAGLGAFLLVSRTRVDRQRLVAAVFIVGGVFYTWLATDVLIPALGGRANYYWSYTALGSNVPQAAWYVVTHPFGSLEMMFTPDVKFQTMLWLFGAFCFLPLLSPISLAAIPLLAERMLANTSPNWWVTSFHYNAYLVVVLVCAAVDGAARLDRWVAWARQRLTERKDAAAAGTASALPDATPAGTAVPEAARETEVPPADQTDEQSGRRAKGRRLWTPLPNGNGAVALFCAAAMCVAGLYLVPKFSFEAALHASFYHRDAEMNAAAAADATVPDGVNVEAVPLLGPQLSPRDTVVLWDGDGGTPATWAPWVVADTQQLQFSWHTVQEQQQRVAMLEHHGYRVVFNRGGYVVLHRAGPK